MPRPINSIIQAHVLDSLKLLPKRRIDLVSTAPPYLGAARFWQTRTGRAEGRPPDLYRSVGTLLAKE